MEVSSFSQRTGSAQFAKVTVKWFYGMVLDDFLTFPSLAHIHLFRDVPFRVVKVP